MHKCRLTLDHEVFTFEHLRLITTMRIIIALISIATCFQLWAQKQTPNEYIDKHKDLAIIEMHRSGVPASITLAQGVLESNSGNSRLAKYANNHFGIKCKGSWTGNVIYADDDAPEECFRAYESVLASYQDHSEFLRKNWRYHELFELKQTDYKGWSKGLRKAGYATNPQYGNILISLIERYDLAQYDKAALPRPSLPNIIVGKEVNGLPVKTAKMGETVQSIAKDNYLKDKHIRKWNDLPSDAQITPGEIVYLKPKRRRGAEEKHVVRKGEDMRDISQLYGIKLKHLYRKNRMDQGAEPQEGETLYMQKKRGSEDLVNLADKKPQWEEPATEKEKFVNPHSVTKEQADNIDFSSPGAINKKDIVVPDVHVVQKGDNIYRIAEKYHVFEEDLLNWNKDLNPRSMKIGQKIHLTLESATANNSVMSKEVINAEIKKPVTKEQIEIVTEDIQVNGPITHLVVKGDTVYSICKRYEISPDQLKEWNNLEGNNIGLGQKLKVSQ